MFRLSDTLKKLLVTFTHPDFRLQQRSDGPAGPGSPERIDLDRSELEAILERAKTAALSQAEYDKLHAAMETLIYLTQELEKNRVSVQRLKQLLSLCSWLPL